MYFVMIRMIEWFVFEVVKFYISNTYRVNHLVAISYKPGILFEICILISSFFHLTTLFIVICYCIQVKMFLDCIQFFFGVSYYRTNFVFNELRTILKSLFLFQLSQNVKTVASSVIGQVIETHIKTFYWGLLVW